jgi:organic hydroperoxide reductase OsmC/OhrA
MDSKQHRYEVRIDWTGNLGSGTSGYRAYSRNHELSAAEKPRVPCSSDPAFRGDPARYNPEELLLASLSACHMLWYLHLCANAKIVVTSYSDSANGTMKENPDGSGEFVAAVLHPRVQITQGSNAETAKRLHEEAHKLCYIARSVNFPVSCEPEIAVAVG